MIHTEGDADLLARRLSGVSAFGVGDTGGAGGSP